MLLDTVYGKSKKSDIRRLIFMMIEWGDTLISTQNMLYIGLFVAFLIFIEMQRRYIFQNGIGINMLLARPQISGMIIFRFRLRHVRSIVFFGWLCAPLSYEWLLTFFALIYVQVLILLVNWPCLFSVRITNSTCTKVACVTSWGSNSNK